MAHWTLYVLKLEQRKWYVGITSQGVQKRFSQHKHGFASARWTRKYRPITIHHTEDLGICDIERAQKYEGLVTRKYMEKYGV
jgi:predicted GIY-YIG superfamily endonuclease